MSDRGRKRPYSIEATVASLLRSIPERWADFDHDALSSTELKALFLLVAAGLVERRIGVRGEFAGEGATIEFTIDATGEHAIVEALDPVIAEMWSKWGPAFEAWNASDAKDATPFRFSRTGLDRWRLTEQGVMARADLDIEAPSAAAAAIVGSYERAIEFVTRTGHQAERPGVRGEGRLVDIKTRDESDEANPTPTPVSLANSEELAAAFRDALIPGLIEALKGNAGAYKGSSSESEARSGDRTDPPIPKMNDAVRRAGESLEWVQRERPELAPGPSTKERYTREQYDHIREHGGPYPLDDHNRTTVPAWDTWSRYVREYLRLTEGRVNFPRRGRTGRSLVRPDELDGLRGDD